MAHFIFEHQNSWVYFSQHSSISSMKLQISNLRRVLFWHFLTIYRKPCSSLQTFTFGNGTCWLTFYLEIWDLAFLTRKSFQLGTKNFDSAEKKPRTRVNAAKIWLRRTTTWKAWKIGSSLSFAMMWENFFWHLLFFFCYTIVVAPLTKTLWSFNWIISSK